MNLIKTKPTYLKAVSLVDIPVSMNQYNITLRISSYSSILASNLTSLELLMVPKRDTHLLQWHKMILTFKLLINTVTNVDLNKMKIVWSTLWRMIVKTLMNPKIHQTQETILPQITFLAIFQRHLRILNKRTKRSKID